MFVCAFVLASIGGNFRVPRNWVTNASYAWLSVVKKIHAIPFVFDFSRENLFLFDRSKIDNLSKMCDLGNSCKNRRKIDKYFPFAKSNLREDSFTHLRHFLTFVCFHWKIAWHLGKETKKLRLRASANELKLSPCVWGSRISTSPLVFSLKRPINHCCRIYTILCRTLKKRLFIEALCRPLFTKYVHCKSLFPFQNNVQWIMNNFHS